MEKELSQIQFQGDAYPQFWSQTSEILQAGLLCEYLLIHIKNWEGRTPSPKEGMTPLVLSYRVRCLNICNRPKGIHFCNQNSNMTFHLTRNRVDWPKQKKISVGEIFYMNQKIFTKEAYMQNFRSLAQKLWICTPTIIFLPIFWPVNLIFSQMKGQI